MIGYRPCAWWKLCWMFFTPMICLVGGGVVGGGGLIIDLTSTILVFPMSISNMCIHRPRGELVPICRVVICTSGPLGNHGQSLLYVSTCAVIEEVYCEGKLLKRKVKGVLPKLAEYSCLPLSTEQVKDISRHLVEKLLIKWVSLPVALIQTK